jgi:SAM-dependent methyltransferase
MSRADSHAGRHAAAVAATFAGLEGPIADLGCGEGIFAGPRTVGVDRDRRVLRPGAAAGDLRHVPLRDGSASGVLCINALHLVPDPERVMEEIDRILRPGGRAYVKNRWYKTPGRRRGLGSLWIRLLHQTRFALHAALHGEGVYRIVNSDGTSALCPACFRRWFASRGYDVRRLARHVVVLQKPPPALFS